MFVCVKDRTCLRMAIPAYCFSMFGSIFGALFCLLIKKLILKCNTIWQSMRKFLWAVWNVSTFPHMDKEKTFLFWKLHIDMVLIFYTFSSDLKIWTYIFWKFSCFNFSERKDINFCLVQMMYVHPLTLNYPLQYAKRVSNITAR